MIIRTINDTLGECKLICCFTGEAVSKCGSVGRQKNKNLREFFKNLFYTKFVLWGKFVSIKLKLNESLSWNCVKKFKWHFLIYFHENKDNHEVKNFSDFHFPFYFYFTFRKIWVGRARKTTIIKLVSPYFLFLSPRLNNV